MFQWLRILMNEAGADPGGGGAPAPTTPAAPADSGGGEPAASGDASAEGNAEPQQDPLERRFLSTQQQLANVERERRREAHERKQLQQRLEELEAKDKLWDDDPIAWMEKRGSKFDDLTRRILEAGPKDPQEQERLEMQQRLKSLEEALASERQSKTEREQTVARQQAVQSLQSELAERADLSYISELGQAERLFDDLQTEFGKYGDELGEEERLQLSNQIAAKLESDARQAVHAQVEKLLKRSPEFRKYVEGLLSSGQDSGNDTTEPGQRDSTATEQRRSRETRRRETAAPQTLTDAVKSAVETRRGNSLDERRAARRERALQRLEGRTQ